MKVIAEIPVWSDSFNSYPPDVKVEVADDFVTLYLADNDREITIKREEFDKFVEVFYGKGVNA